MSLFETATRLNLTFESSIGPLSVSQLWQLPLVHDRKPCLNTVAKDINRKIKDLGDEDFVNTSKKENSESTRLKLMLDVVKRIIEVKLAEQAAATQQMAAASEIARLNDILANKQHDALKELSVEELQARIAQLQGK